MNKVLLTAVAVFPLITGVCAKADVVYSSLPTPTPYSVVSEGYECCGASEVGQGVQLAGDVGANLSSATVMLDNWAMQSSWPGVGTDAGFNVPMTLNLYNVGAGNSVGSLITSDTINALVQWHPAYSTSAACQAIDNSNGYPNQTWLAPDGQCYFGSAQTVSFDLSNVSVPSQFIWGLSFNTTTYGANPIGGTTGGPYDSLNIGLNSNPDGVNPYTPSVGSDLVPGSIYWNTQYGYSSPNYVPGAFQQDTNWAPYDPAISFNSASVTPEPSLLLMVGFALAGLIMIRLRRSRGNA